MRDTPGTPKCLPYKRLFTFQFAADILLFLFIALIPLQDTELANTPLKGIVASPATVPLFFLLLLYAVRWFYRSFPVISVAWLSVTAYVVTVSGAYVCLLRLSPFDFWKPVLNYGLLSCFSLFTVFGIDYRRRKAIRIAVFIALAVTVVGIATDSTASSSVSLFRATANFSGRPRGFSTESSTLSVQVATIGMLTAHYLKSRLNRWFVGIGTCALLVYCDSKGGIIVLLLCGLVFLFTKLRGSLQTKMMISAAVIPTLYVGSFVVAYKFPSIVEANETSTIATRLSMTIYALVTLIHNPLGVGFAGFLPTIPKYLPDAMTVVERIFPFPLAFGEVQQYLYPPQHDADCKTFLFDFLTFFGFPFALCFASFIYKLLRRLSKCEHAWLFVSVTFACFALSTYYSSLNAYAIPLVFGIALQETNQ